MNERKKLYHKKYQQEHREQIRAYKKEWRHRRKEEKQFKFKKPTKIYKYAHLFDEPVREPKTYRQILREAEKRDKKERERGYGKSYGADLLGTW